MYHTPVLLKEAIDGLNVRPSGVYVDVTFGGGGHSREILDRLENQGTLYAFDQDRDAQQNEILDKRFSFIPQNFRYLKRFLQWHKVFQVDGIIADLGISSHQIDTPKRGFSTRYDGPIDMRMNQDEKMKAEDILNDYTAEELQKIFSQYGELRNAKQLANRIVEHRKLSPLISLEQFKEIIRPIIYGLDYKYWAKVFQALRIELNQEIDALKAFLIQSSQVLKRGGRMSVISYHSLEDRLVKNYIKKGVFEGEPAKDFYGNKQLIFKDITKKPIQPSSQEISINNRARSAKLRIGEKI